MIKKRSIFIRPIIIIIDLFIINAVVYFISDKAYLNVSFLSFILIFWVLISYYTKFYNVYRYTHVSKLVTLLISQFFIFSLAYLSYFTIFKEGEVVSNQLIILTSIFGFIVFFKFLIFYLLKKYRKEGKNFRNVVLFGELKTAKKLEKLFHHKNDLGYRFFGFFSDKEYKSVKYIGNIESSLGYLQNKEIDELYFDSSINEKSFFKIRDFAEENSIDLRVLPENKAVYSKNYILEYFGTIPILKPKPLPFERLETHILKRIFDILFSLFICLFLLSWLLPILWFIIRIDSKGSLFFKQKRDGLNGKQFYCYKLRSMKKNGNADIISATKNDKRFTKVGRFLRKTSLDELPQFFNVLLGDMSVVGPRPHINVQTKKYTREVENYLIRHSVKPGITGLAQITGYRGEVTNKSDIDNRVKLDIFYIENWSFFLDIKIITQTIFNIFKNEKKAY